MLVSWSKFRIGSFSLSFDIFSIDVLVLSGVLTLRTVQEDVFQCKIICHHQSMSNIGKGLVINYGEGGLQNGKIAGPKLFAPPLKTG